MKTYITILTIIIASTALATDYHVGADRPLKTISAAAELAQPGDVITVHAGIYRERVSPPRGGESDAKRITYQAAPGEKVVITGSEVIKGWEKAGGDTWKVTILNKFFGAFNPYIERIHGDWCSNPRGYHTGAVYLNGDWLTEAAQMNAVLKPPGKERLWFGQVDKDTTTIWAQFPGVNPNEANVEINVRKTVFTPDKTGINYITVRGFILRNAATNWAPPSAGQIGLVSAYWCKGWVIENNDIAYSKCSGIALGKYSDEFDNTNKAGAADPYTECVRRALKHGWNKETVGSHIVRNNHISHCEQTGIVGSMGCAFSTVTGNIIHDIHVQRLVTGAEVAGLKFHGAIDTVIGHNHIYRCYQGMWLDWMTQGTRVTGNLFHNNRMRDLYVEVNHGPFVVDNNLFLSPVTLNDRSAGGAYIHNLITGSISIKDGSRMTPYHRAHSTEIAGMHNNPSGDNRFYNNIFARRGSLSMYNAATLPGWMSGNVFLQGTKPSKYETSPLLKPDFDPGISLIEKADGWYIELKLDKAWATEQKRALVTTALLGKAKVPDLPYENADGSPLQVDADYSGNKRDTGIPFPGPFEISKSGKQTIKVWPKP
jgi:alpha-L-arabinofuranosidase